MTIIAVVMIVVAYGLSGSSSAGALIPGTPSVYAVPAVRQPLTTDPASPVAHDTENDVLVAQGTRLFASTDQWEYPGSPAHGQILVKNSANTPWKVFEQTQGLRVEDSMASFPIPQDQGMGRGHSLLITVATLNGHNELQWLLDGAKSFSPADSFSLAADVMDVRSFGAHEIGGVWSVYAGVDPTGILRATWSKARHTLVFGPTPELTAATSSSPSLVSQKVTAFANCGGALYATINTELFRRNDGRLPRGIPRWSLLYEEPPVGPHNSGLRGLTCVLYDGAAALLLSTEGDGDVYRLDHLPQGLVGTTPTVRPGHPAAGLAVTLEFSPIPAIRQMLVEDGAAVPATGRGSIVYVIAAYNRFTTVRIGGVTRQLIGFEWAYAGRCPPTRTCGPISARSPSSTRPACFAVRTGSSGTPAYILRCLSGSDFKPTGRSGAPDPRGSGLRLYPHNRSSHRLATGASTTAATTATSTLPTVRPGLPHPPARALHLGSSSTTGP